MVTFGVDAHKRTHTIVAVDDHGKPLGQTTIGTTSKIISGWCGGPPGSARSADGRSKTAVTCPAGWSVTCSAPGKRSSEYRQS